MFFLAIKDGKRRIAISLDEAVLDILDENFFCEKECIDTRFNKSDYIAQLILNDYKIKKAFSSGDKITKKRGKK